MCPSTCRCSVAASCSTCVGLQDPYCGWNIISSKCVPVNYLQLPKSASLLPSEILQNVTTGKHRQCGDSDSPILIEQFTDVHSGGLGDSGGGSGGGNSVDLRIELQVSLTEISWRKADRFEVTVVVQVADSAAKKHI